MIRATKAVPGGRDHPALVFFRGRRAQRTFAQTQPGVATGQTGDAREPPVMRFDPQGIDFAQAVSITLQETRPTFASRR